MVNKNDRVYNYKYNWNIVKNGISKSKKLMPFFYILISVHFPALNRVEANR